MSKRAAMAVLGGMLAAMSGKDLVQMVKDGATVTPLDPERPEGPEKPVYGPLCPMKKPHLRSRDGNDVPPPFYVKGYNAPKKHVPQGPRPSQKKGKSHRTGRRGG